MSSNGYGARYGEQKDIPDVWRVFKAILEAIGIVVSWRGKLCLWLLAALLASTVLQLLLSLWSGSLPGSGPSRFEPVHIYLLSSEPGTGP
jgi:hypothetical protein